MNKTRGITFVGVLSALAIVLYFIEFPLFVYFPAYLKIDLSDIPAILGAIAINPLAGVLIELIKNISHFLLRGGTPLGSGEIANFFAGIGFLIPVAIMMRKRKKNSFLAYLIGAISMTIIANIMNYFVCLPLYGVPDSSARLATIVNFLIPFNLVKAVIISVVTMVLYNKLKAYFEKL